MLLSTALLLLGCVHHVHGVVDKDLIKSLPGYRNADGTQKALPTRHWSGYIPVPVAANPTPPNRTCFSGCQHNGEPSPAGTAFVHYWLVENAAKDPDAPTLVWQQGGPGGSSLIGLFTEVGPLTLNDASFGACNASDPECVPTVFDNPFSWHSAPANMLFVEHPAPTGFSYCEPAQACTWDDESQALVNFNFYVEFFKAYPELAKNEFYFSGESYAGVLVPTVALQILKHKTDANKAFAPFNLGGFAIGNDCPGNQIYTCTPYSGWRGVKVAIDFRFGHGMVPEPLYKQIYEQCADWWDDEPFPHGKSLSMFEAPPAKCAALLEDPVRPCKSIAGDTYRMGGGYFLYDTCSEDMMALNPDDNLPHPAEAAMSRMQHRRQLQAPPTSPEFAMSSGE